MVVEQDHLHRLQRLFIEAQGLAASERAIFLDKACADHPALRCELDSLLASHDIAEAQDFLNEPWLDLGQINVPTRGQSLQRMGPYRVVRELGHGGMGVVYQAERDDIEKQVALKLVHRTLASPATVQRFLFERRILARLEHPHIARLLDAGTVEDGTPFFAMEYVAGQPITTYCDQQRLPVGKRLLLFREICEAVRYAHQNLIIHRDLKPSNILVTKDQDGQPHVKLLDFGIAKLVEEEAPESRLTQTGMRAMTPEYAAPEQVRGQAITTATDVYALGVLLYELLTGNRPYEVRGQTPGEVERLICEMVPAKPSTAVSRVPTKNQASGVATTTTSEAASTARSTEPARLQRCLRGDLDVMCMMALAKEPEQRYPSAEAFLEDIKRHLAGLPVEARPSTVGYRMRKFVQRNRTAVAAVAAIVVLVAGLVGYYTWQLAAERDRVAQELAKSETVTAFLMGLFEAGDPYEALGDTLNVYDLLERGADEAEALADEPLVQAEMLEVVGRVYQQMGEYEPARPLLEQALTLRRAQQGATHIDVAESLGRLAAVLRNQGDYEAAEPLLREAVAIRRSALGDRHPEVASSLNSLGMLLQEQGDYDAAEQIFRQGLMLRKEVLGKEHFSTVSSMNNLALVLHLKGNYDEAEPLFRQVVAIDRATLGDAHPAMAMDMHNLAVLLVDMGHYDEAEALFRETLAMLKQTLGEEHPNVSGVLAGLSMLLSKQGRYAEAEPFTQQALTIEQTKRGTTHPYALAHLKSLGVLRFHQGDHEEAERMLRQALQAYQNQLGAEHPRTARAMVALATVLTAKQDYAAAESLYQEALVMQQRILEPKHLDIIATQQGVAAWQAAQSDYAGAAQRYRQTLARQKEQLSPHHLDLATTMKRLAAVLVMQGDEEAAELLYKDALAIYFEHLGEAHPWSLEVQEALRMLQAAQGR